MSLCTGQGLHGEQKTKFKKDHPTDEGPQLCIAATLASILTHEDEEESEESQPNTWSFRSLPNLLWMLPDNIKIALVIPYYFINAPDPSHIQEVYIPC